MSLSKISTSFSPLMRNIALGSSHTPSSPVVHIARRALSAGENNNESPEEMKKLFYPGVKDGVKSAVLFVGLANIVDEIGVFNVFDVDPIKVSLGDPIVVPIFLVCGRLLYLGSEMMREGFDLESETFKENNIDILEQAKYKESYDQGHFLGTSAAYISLAATVISIASALKKKRDEDNSSQEINGKSKELHLKIKN